MEHESTAMQAPGLQEDTCAPPAPCGLKWDRELRSNPEKEKKGEYDFGEWVTFAELENETNNGCEKCTIVYKGIRLYRRGFEGRSRGASIHKTAQGLSCNIEVQLREGDLRAVPIRLRFFIAKDGCCEWLPPQTLPKLASNTDSAESFARLRQWIDVCDRKHQACSAPHESTLPTRVLDLGVTAVEHGNLRLCEGQNMTAPYITLSHCWGAYQPLRTTKAKLGAHLQGISFTDLPKTFQDAAVTCRRLGIRYLWIDSLCIVQDDEEDWQAESARMASIYADSILTIAASAARDATQGCFLETPDQYALHTLDWPGTVEGGAYSVKVRRRHEHTTFWNNHDGGGQEAPLLGRAWFYQERYLSRRIVHFTQYELSWECQTLSTCESECAGPVSSVVSSSLAPFGSETRVMSLPEPDRRPVEVRNRDNLRGRAGNLTIGSHARDSQVNDTWRLCVRGYTQLSLTFEKDIFPALSGLASKVQDSRPGLTYCAGLWLSTTSNNFNDLVWVNEGFPKSRPSRWRAPTWSWASVLEIMPDWPAWLRLDPQHIYAELEEAKVKPFYADRRGELRDAYIRLRGPLVAGILGSASVQVCDRQNALHPRGAPVYIRGDTGPGGLSPLVRLDVNPKLCKPEIVPGSQVFCLRLGRSAPAGRGQHSEAPRDIALCLRIADSEDGEPIFERIGILSHYRVLDPLTRSQLCNSVKII